MYTDSQQTHIFKHENSRIEEITREMNLHLFDVLLKQEYFSGFLGLHILHKSAGIKYQNFIIFINDNYFFKEYYQSDSSHVPSLQL